MNFVTSAFCKATKSSRALAVESDNKAKNDNNGHIDNSGSSVTYGGQAKNPTVIAGLSNDAIWLQLASTFANAAVHQVISDQLTSASSMRTADSIVDVTAAARRNLFLQNHLASSSPSLPMPSLCSNDRRLESNSSLNLPLHPSAKNTESMMARFSSSPVTTSFSLVCSAPPPRSSPSAPTFSSLLMPNALTSHVAAALFNDNPSTSQVLRDIGTMKSDQSHQPLMKRARIASSASSGDDDECLSKGKGQPRRFRRARIPLKPDQAEILERCFLRAAYLNSKDIYDLSVALNISERKVKVWYQNRRARQRRQVQKTGTGEGEASSALAEGYSSSSKSDNFITRSDATSVQEDAIGSSSKQQGHFLVSDEGDTLAAVPGATK